jgi:hypothetical protein
MAKKTVDAAAAKAKKQKIILAVGAVLLLGVAALQGPKLMSHGGNASTAAPAADSTTGGGGTTPTAQAGSAVAPTAVVVAATGPKVGAVAGVPLTAGPSVKPATSQLASFTLFVEKDPFVPGVSDDAAQGQPASTTDQGSGAPSTDTSSNASTAGTPTASAPGSAPAASAPAPTVYATINLDGKPQQVKVKDDFPAKSPLFVLRSLKKKSAKIGVAGGSFADGEAVTLGFGKKLTLVDTATGVRYVLKLVYTGSEPEVIEGFSSAQSSTSSGSTTSSSATTTTPGATTTTAK